MVPIETVSALNGREHPMARTRRVKRERSNTLRYFRASNPPEPTPLLRVTLIRVGRRALDSGDNLSSALKGVRDQVACILGVNDGGPLVKWVYDQEHGEPGVRVVVEPFRAQDAAPAEVRWNFAPPSKGNSAAKVRARPSLYGRAR